MRKEFVKRGIFITDIYVCTSHDDSDIYRKPNPGMLLKAKEDYSLDMSASVMVGDKERDILAGKNAGCGKTILLAPTSPEQTEADIIIDCISKILKYI
jgi:D-glycero-D-manno-heptose 1,7-bisphosphate phosphatase